MAERKSQLAGLTIRGRCLLAAGIAAGICALVLGERDLLRVAVFVIALPLLAMLLTALSKVGVRATRSVTPGRVPVGGTAEARVQLEGTGRFPVAGLLLEDVVPDALVPGGSPRFTVTALTATGRRNGHRQALAYQVRPVLRGIHPLGPLRARMADPFGLAQYDKQLAGQGRLVVVPKTATLAGLPGDSHSGATAGAGTGASPSFRPQLGHEFDDAAVRQYHYGDDLRRVHWRATAHRDELMVRADERPSAASTTLLLDHRSSAHAGTGGSASLEWAISFVASACLHLWAAGRRVRLVTDDGAVLAGVAEDGLGAAADADSLLDSLAALHPSHRRDLCYRSNPSPDGELIAVLGALGPATAARFAASGPFGGRARAVLLDVPAWSATSVTNRETTGAATALAAAGWGVVTARRGEEAATVWRSLCRQPLGATPPVALSGTSGPQRGGDLG